MNRILHSSTKKSVFQYARWISTGNTICHPRTSVLTEIPPPIHTTAIKNPRQWQSHVPHIRYAVPTIYGITLCTGTFVTAAVLYDRNQQTLWDRLRKHYSKQWSFFGIQDEETMLAELWKEKRDLLIEKRHQFLERWARWLNDLSVPVDIKRAGWMIAEKLTSLTESEKTLASLVGINTLVFVCWQIPRLKPFMSKWFMHLPGSTRNITLLTSAFSHQEFMHFTFNMVGLWSFGKFIHDYLGREQFLAMYLSSAVAANMVSHNFSLLLRNSRPLLPSLGASGAVYSLLASTAIIQPTSSISLIFLPMVPIQLGYALPALMGFDLAGILLKWKMFDHFAHLGGASFGLGYMYYGQQYIWGPTIDCVHEIRQKYKRE